MVALQRRVVGCWVSLHNVSYITVRWPVCWAVDTCLRLKITSAYDEGLTHFPRGVRCGEGSQCSVTTTSYIDFRWHVGLFAQRVV